jgi:hypothetical protein
MEGGVLILTVQSYGNGSYVVLITKLLGFVYFTWIAGNPRNSVCSYG